jgi:hypothetical protein
MDVIVWRIAMNRFLICITSLILTLSFFVEKCEGNRGCCSNHGGISHCDESSRKYKCKDGTLSRSCACEKTTTTETKPDHRDTGKTPLPTRQEPERNYLVEPRNSISRCSQIDDSLSLRLIKAAYDGQKSEVQYLLNRCADPNARGNEQATVLMEASIPGHVEIVELLLKAGADVTLKDKEGWTALRYATAHQQHDVAKILTEFGAKN